MTTTTRNSARALIVGADGKLLLLGVHDESPKEPVNPMPDDFWTTIGGALDPGESFEEAIVRETWEETGFTDISVGPLVWERNSINRRTGTPVRQYERFYVVWTKSVNATPENQNDAEKAGFLEFRWWSVDELEESADFFTPVALPSLIRTALSGTQSEVVQIA